MDVGELITLYRKEAGMTIDELVEKSGVAKGTLNKIIGGVTKAPTLDKMKAISRALGKKLSDFDDDPKPFPLYSVGEKSIINKYRALDERGKEIVDSVLDIEYRQCAESTSPTTMQLAEVFEIPYLLQPASAGPGQIADDEITDKIPVLRNVWTAKADYALRVSGRSMEPDVQDGDIVLVRSQPAVHIGEIGIFIQDSQRYIKVFRGNYLESLNPECENIMPNETTRCIGWVIGVLKPEWIAK